MPYRTYRRIKAGVGAVKKKARSRFSKKIIRKSKMGNALRAQAKKKVYLPAVAKTPLRTRVRSRVRTALARTRAVAGGGPASSRVRRVARVGKRKVKASATRVYRKSTSVGTRARVKGYSTLARRKVRGAYVTARRKAGSRVRVASRKKSVRYGAVGAVGVSGGGYYVGSRRRKKTRRRRY